METSRTPVSGLPCRECRRRCGLGSDGASLAITCDTGVPPVRNAFYLMGSSNASLKPICTAETAVSQDGASVLAHSGGHHESTHVSQIIGCCILRDLAQGKTVFRCPSQGEDHQGDGVCAAESEHAVQSEQHRGIRRDG